MTALSAIGPASALASPCTSKRGESVELCVEGQLQKEGTFALTGQQKEGSYKDVFNLEFATSLEISCGSVNLSKGNIIAGSNGKMEVSGLYLEYPKCRVVEPEHCAVKGGSLLVDGGEGLGTGPGLSAALTKASEVTLLGGGTGEKWTKYEVVSSGGTCSASYEEIVKGNAKCQLPESTVEAVTHLLKCEPSGNELKSSGHGAKFALTMEVKLTSGKKWSI